MRRIIILFTLLILVVVTLNAQQYNIVGTTPISGTAIGVEIYSNFAYVLVKNVGIKIFDISDSKNPIPSQTNISSDAFCFKIKNDILVVGEINTNSISIYQLKGHELNPLKLVSKRFDYNPVQYGGSFSTPYSIEINGNYAYIWLRTDCCEKIFQHGIQGIEILNIQDASNPTHVQYYPTEGILDYDATLGYPSIPSQISIVNNYLFAPECNYYWDPSPNPSKKYCWGTKQLEIYKINSDGSLSLSGNINNPFGDDRPYKVLNNNKALYIITRTQGSTNMFAHGTDGFYYFNISNINNPSKINFIQINGVNDIKLIQDKFLFISTDNSIELYDISSELQPKFISSLKSKNIPYGLNCNGEFLYVADNNYFTIMQSKKPNTITINSPSLGDTCIQGTTQKIKWTSNYSLGKVNIYYKAEGDADYQPFSSNPSNNNGSYDWLIPEQYKEQVTIKIEDADDHSIFKISDVFNIIPKASNFRPNPDGFCFYNSPQDMWPNTQDPFPPYSMFLDAFGLDDNLLNRAKFLLMFKFDGWKGSCYGFSLSSLLLYCNYLDKGNQTTYEIPLDNQSRYLNNKYQLYGFDRNVSKYRNQCYNQNYKPSDAVREIKESFKKDGTNNQDLYLYNQSTDEAHSVVPYRVSSTNDIYDSIFVYNCNLPGNENIYILVNRNTNIWTYPKHEWNVDWSGSWGLIPELDVSYFKDNKKPELMIYQKENILATKMRNDILLNSDTSKIEIFFSDSNDVYITNKNGEQISNHNISDPSKMKNAYPILPITGGKQRIAGFYIDQIGNDFINLSNIFLSKDTTSFGIFTSNTSIVTKSKGTFLGISNLYYDYQNDSLMQTTQSNINNYNLSILNNDTKIIKEFDFKNSSFNSGDSLSVKLLNSAKTIKLINSGKDKNYSVSFKTDKNNYFIYDSTVDFKKNQVHIYTIQDWTNLQDNSKKLTLTKIDNSKSIEIDLRTGKVTDVNEFTNEKLIALNIQPNPTSENISINYSLMEVLPVTISISDCLGNQIDLVINNKTQEFGNQSIQYNVSSLNTGIYFCTLKAGNYIETVKFVVIK